MTKVHALAYCFLSVLLLAGCSGSDGNSVTGRVTFKDGTPLKNAGVTFTNKDAQGVVATGATDEEGKYFLSRKEVNDGAPAGNYVVTITPPPPAGEGYSGKSAQPVDPKFTDQSKSPLTYAVKDGKNEFNIEVE
jgi:hypothetical protein